MSHILKATAVLTAPFDRKVTDRLPLTSVRVVPGGKAPTVCRGLACAPGLNGFALGRTIQPWAHEAPSHVGGAPVPVLAHTDTPPGRSSLIASLRAVLRASMRLFCCVHCWSFCMKVLNAGTARLSRIESTTIVTSSSISVNPRAGPQHSPGPLSTKLVNVMGWQSPKRWFAQV